MTGLITAWLAEVLLITYRGVKQGSTQNLPNGLPLPSTYLSSFLVYGALGLLPESAAPFATAVGWGFVVATALNLYTPPAPGQTLGSPQVATSKQSTAAGNTAA